ncbi:hypothetical protein BKA25_002622 [Actinoalloteichus hymeniacidonis]|uniref:Uncharacterized protein n=1 Tax=Actinoalloteichus hymeniacidonis TaxID=340345 RepID=A0AAC9MZ76_9PSEU|nr:hypothetical protein TL08_14160 [Actinoalloteichus hymeniacidonis]MBB5908306.1 hypothetical protein [Actinoalloteichus hymeniacidonis]
MTAVHTGQVARTSATPHKGLFFVLAALLIAAGCTPPGSG